MKFGYIYILSQSSGRSVKVGKTRVSSQSRLKSYTRDYDLKDFKLFKEFEVFEEALDEIERLAHKGLKKFQISGLEGAREIFACDPSEAVEQVNKAIVKSAKRQKAADRERLREKKRRQKERDWRSSKDFLTFLDLDEQLEKEKNRKKDLASKKYKADLEILEQSQKERHKLSIFWGALIGVIGPCILPFIFGGSYMMILLVWSLIGLAIYAVYFIHKSDDQTLEQIFPESFNVNKKNISYYDEEIEKAERKIKNLISKKENIKSSFFGI